MMRQGYQAAGQPLKQSIGRDSERRRYCADENGEGSNMRQAELEQATREYLAKGGQVKQVEPNVRAIDDGLRHCRCGCRGNYTDHTMRLGERGIR